jgi:serine phosphatase RsbU (regulator of sigma subunit)
VDRQGHGAFLEKPSSLPLGVDPATAYDEGATELEPGSALVLYTDGLVERRGVDMAVQLERLARVAGTPDSALALRERILDELVDPGSREDDVALVVALRLP